MLERPHRPEMQADSSLAEKVRSQLQNARQVKSQIEEQLSQKMAEREMLNEKRDGAQDIGERLRFGKNLEENNTEIMILRRQNEEADVVLQSLGDSEDVISTIKPRTN